MYKMELYERLDLTKINFLNKMDFNEFKQYCNTSCKNDAERKIKFNMMKSFCEVNIKCKGEVRRIYSYTLKTPNEVGGRLYCGNSIQGLSKIIRGFLCKDWTDIDMKNAHPTIAKYLCKKNNIECPNLSYYIENRNQICERFGEDGKVIFLKALNDDKLNRKVKDEFFKAFDKECKMIQSKINAIPEYKHIVDTTPLDKAYNWNGSAFNRIMCVYENKILQEVITVLNSQDITIGALMFDGLMIYPFYDQDSCKLIDWYRCDMLLRDIERRVNMVFQGLDMVFDYKRHDETIKMPEYQEEYDAEADNDDCYESVKKEFEENHAKIVEKALFLIEKGDGEIVLLQAPKFKTAYEDIKYMDYSGEKPVQKEFICRWFKDEFKRSYDDMGVYPPPLICPKNIYNMWKPFEISKYTEEYIKDEVGLQKFLNHIKILSGNDENVAKYIVMWFAQMFQFPATKTVAPTFISEEGAGKGTLLELIGSMMGTKKILVTTQPSRDVWGEFNSLMCNSFLVNLNEMCKKESMESEGKIKGLITDKPIVINKKGIDGYSIDSYHRFIITTNSEDPIKTKKGDRRNIIIRSSDEKAEKTPENMAYFNDLRESFAKIDTMRTIYDYLMEIKGMDKFSSIIPPTTSYQNDMKEASRNPYDMWVEDMIRNYKIYVNKNENGEFEKDIKLYGASQLSLFNEWRSKNGIQFDTNTIKMALGIKRMNIKGITCGVSGMKGNSTHYNIELLQKHYLIGCQITI